VIAVVAGGLGSMNRVRSDLQTDLVAGAASEQQEELKEKSIGFIAQLERTLRDDGEDAAMRFVYRRFYSLRKEQNYRLCDCILEDVDAARLPPIVLIAFLTITAPLRNQLSNRIAFYARARAAIDSVRDPKAAYRLLVGLD
jgi:hypothetical protein